MLPALSLFYGLSIRYLCQFVNKKTDVQMVFLYTGSLFGLFRILFAWLAESCSLGGRSLLGGRYLAWWVLPCFRSLVCRNRPVGIRKTQVGYSQCTCTFAETGTLFKVSVQRLCRVKSVLHSTEVLTEHIPQKAASRLLLSNPHIRLISL